MTLFNEKDVIIAYCEQCNGELYEGEEVWKHEDLLFCDENCFKDFIRKELVIVGLLNKDGGVY